VLKLSKRTIKNELLQRLGFRNCQRGMSKHKHLDWEERESGLDGCAKQQFKSSVYSSPYLDKRIDLYFGKRTKILSLLN
jgi:hypothetical protein